jgi:hypothetical protein
LDLHVEHLVAAVRNRYRYHLPIPSLLDGAYTHLRRESKELG